MPDLTALALQGIKLTAAEVAALEATPADPADEAARHAKILGYYFSDERGPDTDAARVPHILWLIDHLPHDRFTSCPFCRVDPEHPGYEQFKAHWIKQVEAHPADAPLLTSAAKALAEGLPKDAEKLLRQAAAAAPTNPEPHQSLATLIARNLHTDLAPDHRAATAREALAEYQHAADLTVDPRERSYLYPQLADMALAAGDEAAAKRYADAMLAAAAEFPGDWNAGNAIYKANTTLGRLALARDDAKAAGEYLLAAADTPGSPQLNSFGPNTTLARDLLLNGQRDVVLTYFQRCAKFWKIGTRDLEQWTRTVKEGGMPDWGAHLDY